MGTDLVTDRIKLVYEYNKDSSLFARVASIQIAKGNYLEAINILNEGMSKHPNYPTSLFILALAKAYEGKEDEAREAARIASELINSPKSLEHYNVKIEQILSERNAINSSSRTQFMENEDSDSQIELFEDKLENLAQELSRAKIIPSEEVEEIPEIKSKRILSDTMADIYVSQKKYEEAVEIFEELMNQKPEKAEFYLQKISDIKGRME